MPHRVDHDPYSRFRWAPPQTPHITDPGGRTSSQITLDDQRRADYQREIAAIWQGINIGEGIGELGPTGPRTQPPGPISEFLLDKAKKQWSLSVPGIIQQRGWQGLTEPFRNADWGAANPRWLWDKNYLNPVVRNPNPFRDWTRSGSSPGG